jgi:hypothetical protein
MKKRERIIQLVTEINTLRGRTEALEKELDSLLPPDDEHEDVCTESTGKSSGLVAGSMASRIVELLNSHPDRSFDALTIAKELGIANLNSLRGTLLRVAESERIRKVRRGTYKAGREQTAET